MPPEKRPRRAFATERRSLIDEIFRGKTGRKTEPILRVDKAEAARLAKLLKKRK